MLEAVFYLATKPDSDNQLARLLAQSAPKPHRSSMGGTRTRGEEQPPIFSGGGAF